MMPRSSLYGLLAAIPFAFLPLAAQAETPNIEPGEWEYTNTTTMDGAHQMPEQTETYTECVTEEDLARGEEMIEAPEGCSVDSMDMRADGVDYTMTCTDPDGTSMDMEGSMQFMGDRAEGEMRSEIDSPMGPMSVRITVEGQRIGDC
ncbi:DUF3617 family protein [Thioalkalivibrio sp. ARh3]|uniref:DUF3617 domain-containing protein n=1 Tax=Thioalkalivibrio sp. ARh3 TaxID=1158148 RepID=UPI000360D543|nr:DUF3617 family protein [Thioalkalivibrio sp. ARh3]